MEAIISGALPCRAVTTLQALDAGADGDTTGPSALRRERVHSGGHAASNASGSTSDRGAEQRRRYVDVHTAPRSVVSNRILFVGSITEKKGVRELCLSMSQVVRRHPGAELYLVGRDVATGQGGVSFRDEVLRLLDHGTSRHIRFLGGLPRQEVSKMVASAHICVFPSYMETQGIVVAEAMACGRPVVVTRAGPGPDVLGPDGECGWLVDPKDQADIADKICRLLGNGRMCELQGGKGRLRAEDHFSVQSCIDRNIAFYSRVACASH